MKESEKIRIIVDNNYREWSLMRKQMDEEFSKRQAMFCVCGKLATGLHERSCNKFNKRVTTETVKRLKHLLNGKPVIRLLSIEQYNSPENQNRDNAIIGYRNVQAP